MLSLEAMLKFVLNHRQPIEACDCLFVTSNRKEMLELIVPIERYEYEKINTKISILIGQKKCKITLDVVSSRFCGSNRQMVLEYG